MTGLWITLAALGYLAIAAAVIRGFAWDSERRGTRERELARYGLVGEVLPGIVWPITLLILAAGCLLVGFHALATKGIGKGTQ
ncbi:hypothetical protein BJF79_13560 [Actinomadura sp. CNU-125]|uniref:hypothetical protein n=1 Tax=Actinomadura sp. CNU-125 TaxID=1904961 RepID=UPI000961C4DE|nr:hypothetical protein [Actinomadura sp. CNU-125]OLT24365.1 hypothetical protein BJF79_13560 [Actinomadura sp. CNU-125]